MLKDIIEQEIEKAEIDICIDIGGSGSETVSILRAFARTIAIAVLEEIMKVEPKRSWDGLDNGELYAVALGAKRDEILQNLL